MITGAGSVTADAGAEPNAGNGLRRLGSKSSTRPETYAGLIAGCRSARLASGSAHAVTATARKTKAGKQAVHRMAERLMIKLFVSTPRWSPASVSAMLNLLKTASIRQQLRSYRHANGFRSDDDACPDHAAITTA